MFYLRRSAGRQVSLLRGRSEKEKAARRGIGPDRVFNHGNARQDNRGASAGRTGPGQAVLPTPHADPRGCVVVCCLFCWYDCFFYLKNEIYLIVLAY